MELRKRLIQAIDDTIASNYEVWNLQSRIFDRISKCSNICLYGAGKFLRDTVKVVNPFQTYGIDVKYVCDSNEHMWGKYIDIGTTESGSIISKEIISFEQLKRLKDCIVIVTVGNPKEIQILLNQWGIENYKFGDLVLNVYTPHYDSAYFAENKNKILEVYDLLADDKSRKIFTEVFCNSAAPQLAKSSFAEIYEENEYFATGIFNLIPEEECIVDCGAYVGDSLEQYMNLFHNRVNKYYCFEFNNGTADILQKVIDKYQNPEIKLIRAGVSDENKMIQIADTSNMSSTKIESADLIEARLVRLDDELKNEKVSYIKMDIEGEELAALRGAETIIKNLQPKLAVSAYHFLSDLWEVPLLIHKFNKNYQIYFRHHTPVVWDTDCYAVMK